MKIFIFLQPLFYAVVREVLATPQLGWLCTKTGQTTCGYITDIEKGNHTTFCTGITNIYNIYIYLDTCSFLGPQFKNFPLKFCLGKLWLLPKSCRFKRLFGIFLFHKSYPSRPLIIRLKWFCWNICFRRDIHKKLWMTPRRLTLRRVKNFNFWTFKTG